MFGKKNLRPVPTVETISDTDFRDFLRQPIAVAKGLPEAHHKLVGRIRTQAEIFAEEMSKAGASTDTSMEKVQTYTPSSFAGVFLDPLYSNKEHPVWIIKKAARFGTAAPTEDLSYDGAYEPYKAIAVMRATGKLAIVCGYNEINWKIYDPEREYKDDAFVDPNYFTDDCNPSFVIDDWLQCVQKAVERYTRPSASE